MGKIGHILIISFLALIFSVFMLINTVQNERAEYLKDIETIKRGSFQNGKVYYELGVAVYANEHKNDSVMLTIKELDRINEIVDSITVASKYKY